MNVSKALALLWATLVLSGCVSNSLYSWGKYEGDMYKYYKNPGYLEELMTNLKETLEAAEANRSVPPGLYAEYGYLLLETGNARQAVVYFVKEKEAWPESTIIMDTMLAAAQADLDADQ